MGSFYQKKSFWLIGTAVASPFLYWAYDRYETRNIMQRAIAMARPYGLEGLARVSMASVSSPPSSGTNASSGTTTGPNGAFTSPNATPNLLASSLMHRRFTLLLQEDNALQLKHLFDDVWCQYIEPIWTAAGVDYIWLDASLKKHENEHEKMWKQLDFQRDHANDDNTPSSSPSTSQHYTPPPASLFQQVTAWRVRYWFIEAYQSVKWKDTLQTYLRKQQEFESASFLSRWFFKEAWTSMSPPTESQVRQQCIQDSRLFRELSDLIIGCHSPSPSPITSFEESIAIRVMTKLIPNIDRLPIDITDMFHEGLIGVSQSVAHQIIQSLHDISINYPIEFATVFPNWSSGHALRLGYLPTPLEISISKDPLIIPSDRQAPPETESWTHRIISFFHHRHLAAFYSSWALAYIQEKACPFSHSDPNNTIVNTFYLTGSL